MCYQFPMAVLKKNCHTWWLKITEIYSLRVLEAGSLKLRYQKGPTPSGGTKNPFLPLPASGGSRIPWLMAA